MPIQVIRARCVVVGSGIAGLSAALGHGDAIVVSKSTLGDGSSRWAQGGIAAAIGHDDHPELHAEDTLSVSAQLGVPSIASLVAHAAPERIEWLQQLGARFDAADGELALGREAGHRRHRIVHANGDATGAEVMRSLTAAVTRREDIETFDNTFALDLIRSGTNVVGVLAMNANGEKLALLADSVVLATGGIGRLYRHTTNPPEVTGDGLAMALRAGAAVRNLEFVQFHPTALKSGLDPMPLLTEALRGEGATLVDESGHRYMLDAHDDAELAPRDVVARHNYWRSIRGPVFLDARLIGEDFPHRFPTVWAIAQQAGIDPRHEPLPVSPAVHYHMGGIVTDSLGHTSLPGLFAAGEVASTGLHGANRLASNSLLEGLVFGARVAQSATSIAPSEAREHLTVPNSVARVETNSGDCDEAIERLRTVMWRHVGVVRDEQGLSTAVQEIGELADQLDRHAEGRNMAVTGSAIARCALERRESRGSHYRSDHPTSAGTAEPSQLSLSPEPSSPIDLATEPATKVQA